MKSINISINNTYINSRLKLMQAISMVARDNYILDMKLKIDTSDFFTYLEKIFRKFIPPSEGEWKGSGSHNGDGNWLKTYNLYQQ